MPKGIFKAPTRRKPTRIKSKIFVDPVKGRGDKKRTLKGHLRELKRLEKVYNRAMKGSSGDPHSNS